MVYVSILFNLQLLAVKRKNFKAFRMKNIRELIELHVFGVCAAIGEKMGIATSKIRMWFIYISFLTLGSPVLLYMILAFWLNIKNYIYSARRNPLKYL